MPIRRRPNRRARTTEKRWTSPCSYIVNKDMSDLNEQRMRSRVRSDIYSRMFGLIDWIPICCSPNLIETLEFKTHP
jgi:hypothetical protein